jgi:hypothetical protein
VDVREGDLGLLDRRKRVTPAYVTQEERDQFFQELVWIARDRGYRDGWASHKFKEKFGDWPRNNLAVPRVPSQATRSWVLSRQIAYSKGMAKRQAVAQ